MHFILELGISGIIMDMHLTCQISGIAGRSPNFSVGCENPNSDSHAYTASAASATEQFPQALKRTLEFINSKESLAV